jgi:hypothetical protein
LNCRDHSAGYGSGWEGRGKLGIYPSPHRFMEKNSELRKKGNIQILITNLKVLWHVDPLLHNNHEISNYTNANTR